MQSQDSQPANAQGAAGVPMPKRNRRAVLVPLAIVGVLVAVTAGTLFNTFVPVAAVDVEPVIAEHVSAPVVTEDQPTTGGRVVQAPGWLEADPYLVACTALADGVVDEILVLEGETVEAGQLVATLVDDDAKLALEDAKARLMLAAAEQQTAQAALEAAKTDWDNPVEDQRMVGVYRAKIATKQNELEQLDSLIAMETARLEGLQEELERSTEALQSGAATDTKIILQQKAVDAQAGMLRATQQRRGILESHLAEYQSELDAATEAASLRVDDRLRLDSAKASVARADANARAAQSAVDTAQLRLDRMTIEAPISGNVQRRLKQPGDKVMLQMDSMHSAHILHLYDPSKLQVRVDVPLADAAELFVGQQCEVVIDVLPDTEFQGEVARITHEADLQKNTLQVKVSVKDPLPILKPEMLTRVKFLPRGSTQTSSSASPDVSHRSVFLVSPDRISDLGEEAHVSAIRQRKGQVGRVEIVRVDRLGQEDGFERVIGDLHASDLLAAADASLSQNQRVSFTAKTLQGGQP